MRRIIPLSFVLIMAGMMAYMVIEFTSSNASTQSTIPTQASNPEPAPAPKPPAPLAAQSIIDLGHVQNVMDPMAPPPVRQTLGPCDTPLPESFKRDGIGYLDTSAFHANVVVTGGEIPLKVLLRPQIAILEKDPHNQKALAEAAGYSIRKDYPPAAVPYLVRLKATGKELTEAEHHTLVDGLSMLGMFKEAAAELVDFEKRFSGFNSVLQASNTFYECRCVYAIKLGDMVKAERNFAALEYCRPIYVFHRYESSCNKNIDPLIRNALHERDFKLSRLNDYWIYHSPQEVTSIAAELQAKGIRAPESLTAAQDRLNLSKPCSVKALMRRSISDLDSILNFLGVRDVDVAKRAVEVCPLNDSDERVSALFCLADAAHQHGDIETESQAALEAEKVSERLNKGGLIFESKLRVGAMYEQLSDSRTAVLKFNEAAEIARKYGADETLKRAQMQFVVSLCHIGFAPEIWKTMPHTRDYDDTGEYEYCVGVCLDEMGMLQDAIARMQMQMQLGGGKGVFLTLIPLELGSLFMRTGKFREAEEAFSKAEQAEHDLNNPEARWQWQLGKARARMAQKDPAGARTYLDAALATIEAQRASLRDYHHRQTLQDNKYDAYDLAMELALKSKNVGEAFNAAERGRARTFLDALGSENARVAKSTPIIDLHDYETLSSDYCSVIFYECADSVLAWVVQNNHTELITIPCSMETLSKALITFRKSLGEKDVNGIKTACRNLYRLLWAPIDKKLPQWRRVCIVPHGLLHYIPFQALLDGESFLIEKGEMFYAPSASGLAALIKRSGRSAPGVALFDSILSDDPKSPFASTETEFIAKMYRNPSVFMKSQATVDAFKANALDKGTIHVASHGSFDNWFPIKSGLHLRGNGKDDAVLRASDVYAMKFTGAPLVVISACVSSVGDLAGGNEVTGLTRAFQVAGAQNVIGSLWPVDNAATTRLMSSFYEQLVRMPEDPVAALCEAQRRLLKTDPHPALWAAFEISGTGSRR